MSVLSLWRIFSGLHRFPWIGVRAGLAVGRFLRLPMHQVRDVMIAVDALLSSGLYLSSLALPTSVVLSVITGNPAPMVAALILFLVWRSLVGWERELARRHWLKRLDIYSVDTGSARTLRGRVVIGHVFLEESGGDRYWTKKRMEAVINRARRASRWIVDQARSYGVDVEISHDHALARRALAEVRDLREDLQVGDCIATEALALAGTNREKDSVCVVVHVPFPCTSFAVPASLGQRRGPVEWCVAAVCASEAVLAHEILHLFGADDHYHCLTDDERRAKQILIGRSIMFDASRPLAELVVDGVTAQGVGWL